VERYWGEGSGGQAHIYIHGRGARIWTRDEFYAERRTETLLCPSVILAAPVSRLSDSLSLIRKISYQLDDSVVQVPMTHATRHWLQPN
jgi:hypothetical protein